MLYSITGLWSALAGSILLWGVVLGGYATAMVWRFRRRADEDLVAWATLVVYVVAAFFFGLMLGPSDPFAHVVGAVPTNGLGPNSLLQDNPLVLVHPPMLYLGLVGFTLPFAFAVASLITGRLDEDWQGETRRWTLFAWAFLTHGDPARRLVVLPGARVGRVLGMGPGGERRAAALAGGTAYLHSVMVQQRRGLLRIWNLSLVVAAFSLTILGTFLTRSGVTQSVHSFSDSTIGPLLLGFFGVVLVTGVGLIAWRGRPAPVARRHRLAGQPGGCLPGQQPAVRGLRLRRAAGYRLPPLLRGPRPRHPDRRWGRPTSTGSSSRSAWPSSS